MLLWSVFTYTAQSGCKAVHVTLTQGKGQHSEGQCLCRGEFENSDREHLGKFHTDNLPLQLAHLSSLSGMICMYTRIEQEPLHQALPKWNPRAGLVEEDLEPLRLSKEQRSALLIMLRQSKRTRLVMRDNKHTYFLPQ